MSAPAKHIVIITGMSGSGKSTAIRALEDAGFFCIDNLPVLLLPKLTELAEAGVDLFNIYLMNGDEEEQLERYGREIIPQVNR